MNRTQRIWKGIAASAILVLAASCRSEDGSTGRTVAGVIASQRLEAGALVQARLQVGSCSSADGASVALEGGIALDGLVARLTFTNNRSHLTHSREESFTASLVILDAGDTLEIPWDPSSTDAAEDPHVWIQFLDGEGEPLTGEVYLGRCASGLADVNLALALPAEALVFDTTRTDCRNSPGPELTLDAQLVVAGAKARFVLRDTEDPLDASAMVATVETQVIAPGVTFTFPKQPVQGGVGGNPWIFLELLDGTGDPLGEPMLLGRCRDFEQGRPRGEGD